MIRPGFNPYGPVLFVGPYPDATHLAGKVADQVLEELGGRAYTVTLNADSVRHAPKTDGTVFIAFTPLTVADRINKVWGEAIARNSARDVMPKPAPLILLVDDLPAVLAETAQFWPPTEVFDDYPGEKFDTEGYLLGLVTDGPALNVLVYATAADADEVPEPLRARFEERVFVTRHPKLT